jgi:hypothetical protein
MRLVTQFFVNSSFYLNAPDPTNQESLLGHRDDQSGRDNDSRSALQKLRLGIVGLDLITAFRYMARSIRECALASGSQQQTRAPWTVPVPRRNVLPRCAFRVSRRL